jgi:hypothetical protein
MGGGGEGGSIAALNFSLGTRRRTGQPHAPPFYPKPYLCIMKLSHHEIVCVRRSYSSARFVGSALDGSEWPVSHCGRFTSEDMVPGTNWVGGRVDSRAGPGAFEE